MGVNSITAYRVVRHLIQVFESNRCRLLQEFVDAHRNKVLIENSS
jgi:hypothetical protein